MSDSVILSLVYTAFSVCRFKPYFLKIFLYFHFYIFFVLFFSFLSRSSFIHILDILFLLQLFLANHCICFFLPQFVCFSHFCSLCLSVCFLCCVFVPVQHLILSYLFVVVVNLPPTLSSAHSHFTVSSCLVITFCCFAYLFFQFFYFCHEVFLPDSTCVIFCFVLIHGILSLQILICRNSPYF